MPAEAAQGAGVVPHGEVVAAAVFAFGDVDGTPGADVVADGAAHAQCRVETHLTAKAGGGVGLGKGEGVG